MTKATKEPADKISHRAPRSARRTELESAEIERIQEEIGNKATERLVSRLADAGIVAGDGSAVPESHRSIIGRIEPRDRFEVDQQIDPPDDEGEPGEAPPNAEDGTGDESASDVTDDDDANGDEAKVVSDDSHDRSTRVSKEYLGSTQR